MSRILISYRRGDASGIARRLHGELAGRYGHDEMAIDIDVLPPATGVDDVIADEVRRAEVTSRSRTTCSPTRRHRTPGTPGLQANGIESGSGDCQGGSVPGDSAYVLNEVTGRLFCTPGGAGGQPVVGWTRPDVLIGAVLSPLEPTATESVFDVWRRAQPAAAA